jgi:hypothetical protein
MLLALTQATWIAIAIGAGVLLVGAVEILLLRTMTTGRRDSASGAASASRRCSSSCSRAGIWHVFGGHIGLVVGLGAAGLGFALQNVIGAVFGWIGIVASGVFGIGDRISFAGVEGDVIDLARSAP